MIGRTLFGYFLNRHLMMTIQFIVGVTLISFLVDFTEFSRRTASLKGYTVSLALLASALRVPLILQIALPFTILFAGIATLSTLNRRYELVVARAAGVSAWQFLAPLCLASLMIGVFATAVFNPIAARSLAMADEIEAGFHGSASGGRKTTKVPWLRQQTEDGITFIGAARFAKRGLLLSDATFLELGQDGRIMRRVDARRAELASGNWNLKDAIVIREGQTPRPQERMRIKSNLVPAYVEEQFASPELIPFYELPRKIAASRSFGLSGNAFATHFHSLLALPALLVAMTLIAATVSMRFARMGQSATIILGGILAGFLLYVVSVLVKAFGNAGFVPPVAAAWIPVLVASFFGVTFLLYKEDG